MDESTAGNEEMEFDLEIEQQEEPVNLEVAAMRLEMARDELAAEIEKKFEERRGRRATKEAEWLESESLYLGSLANNFYRNSDKPFQPVKTKKKPKHNAVKVKCDTILSVLESMQFSAGNKNWDIVPTAYPTGFDGQPIPAAQAQQAADLMEAKIEDRLNQCKYPRQVRRALRDKVILGTGIIKGPLLADEPYVKYEYQESSDGQIVAIPRQETKEAPATSYVSPWFFFPDDSAVNVKDCGDSLELHPLSDIQVRELKKRPGFDASAIDRALNRSKPGTEQDNTYFSFTALTDNAWAFKNSLRVLEYYGPVTLDTAGKIGLEAPVDELAEEIYAEIWVLNGVIIKAKQYDIDACFRVPYAVDVWHPDPSSIFGMSLPLEQADQQRVMDNTYSMILDNAEISSGPQVIIDRSKIVPANGEWELHPDKFWYNLEADRAVKDAIEFFVPDNVTSGLMEVFNMAKSLSMEEAAMPFFQPATQSSQPTDTAYGTKMMAQYSTTVVEFHNESWDDNITAPVIEGMYHCYMQYGNDPRIMGDFEVDVWTSSQYRSKQIIVADLEKLSVEASQNPDFGMLIDKSELAKARLSAMNVPFKGIVKSPEQVQRDMEAAAQQGPPPEIQIKMKELELKEQDLKLKQEEMQINAQERMRLAELDHEEKMGAIFARIKESDAQVLSEDKKLQVELVKLLQSEDMANRQMAADMLKAAESDATKRFMKGIDFTAKVQDLAFKEKELKYAEREGKGI